MNNEYFAMRRNERVRSGERLFFSVRLCAAYTHSATGFRLVHPQSPVRNRTKKEIAQLAIKSQLAPLGGRRGCAQTCDFIAARFALYFRQLFTSRAVRCTQPVLRALKNKPKEKYDR